MKHDIVPCFWIGDLEDALEVQYGPEFMEDLRAENDDLRNIMFDEFYMNDVCCKYSLETDEDDEEIMSDKVLHFNQCIRAMLADMFPEAKYVVVDVMW